jgi:hypothetical protein
MERVPDFLGRLKCRTTKLSRFAACRLNLIVQFLFGTFGLDQWWRLALSKGPTWVGSFPPELSPVLPFLAFLSFCRCSDSTLRWATAVLLSIYDLSTRCCISYAVEEMSLNGLRNFGTWLPFVNPCWLTGIPRCDAVRRLSLKRSLKGGMTFRLFPCILGSSTVCFTFYICVCFHTSCIQKFSTSHSIVYMKFTLWA